MSQQEQIDTIKSKLSKSSVYKFLLLFGIFLPLFSFVFLSNYNHQSGIVTNIMKGNIELYKYPVTKQGCLKEPIVETDLETDYVCAPINPIREFIRKEMNAPSNQCVPCAYKDYEYVKLPYKYIVLLSAVCIFIGSLGLISEKSKTTHL
jgi:hypothetical protein